VKGSKKKKEEKGKEIGSGRGSGTEKPFALHSL
jgi:hypothetical protein